MIKARIYKAGKACGLELEGHADYAKPGQDLVCAAVSTLAFAFESYLNNLDAAGELQLRQAPLVETGKARLAALPRMKSTAGLEGVFEFMGCFLSLLEENYPKNIEFTDDFGRKRRNDHDEHA